jgi:hypothetical protein
MSRRLLAVLAVALLVGAAVAQEDAPESKPAAKPPPAKPAAAKPAAAPAPAAEETLEPEAPAPAPSSGDKNIKEEITGAFNNVKGAVSGKDLRKKGLAIGWRGGPHAWLLGPRASPPCAACVRQC